MPSDKSQIEQGFNEIKTLRDMLIHVFIISTLGLIAASYFLFDYARPNETNFLPMHHPAHIASNLSTSTPIDSEALLFSAILFVLLVFMLGWLLQAIYEHKFKKLIEPEIIKALNIESARATDKYFDKKTLKSSQILPSANAYEQYFSLVYAVSDIPVKQTNLVLKTHTRSSKSSHTRIEFQGLFVCCELPKAFSGDLIIRGKGWLSFFDKTAKVNGVVLEKFEPEGPYLTQGLSFFANNEQVRRSFVPNILPKLHEFAQGNQSLLSIIDNKIYLAISQCQFDVKPRFFMAEPMPITERLEKNIKAFDNLQILLAGLISQAQAFSQDNDSRY